MKYASYRQCCGPGMFILDTDFFPNPDLGSRIQQQKRGEGKNLTYFISEQVQKKYLEFRVFFCY